MKSGTILHGDRTIPYELVQKPVKNINIHVREDGLALVSANRRVPVREVERILQEKAEFLLRARERLALRHTQTPPPHQYLAGEQFRVLGRMLTLQTAIAREISATVSDNSTLLLCIPQGASMEGRRNGVTTLLLAECRRVFQEAAAEAEALLKGRPLPDAITLRIRRMTSRWGSCIPAKRVITLSTRLLETPWSCVQAVALHEYAHFLHADHSSAFYTELEAVMPDYQQRVALLRSLAYSFFYNE